MKINSLLEPALNWPFQEQHPTHNTHVNTDTFPFFPVSSLKARIMILSIDRCTLDWNSSHRRQRHRFLHHRGIKIDPNSIQPPERGHRCNHTKNGQMILKCDAAGFHSRLEPKIRCVHVITSCSVIVWISEDAFVGFQCDVVLYTHTHTCSFQPPWCIV